MPLFNILGPHLCHEVSSVKDFTDLKMFMCMWSQNGTKCHISLLAISVNTDVQDELLRNSNWSSPDSPHPDWLRKTRLSSTNGHQHLLLKLRLISSGLLSYSSPPQPAAPQCSPPAAHCQNSPVSSNIIIGL